MGRRGVPGPSEAREPCMWELRGYRVHNHEDGISLDGAWRAGASCCPMAFDVQVTDARRGAVRGVALASWGGAAQVEGVAASGSSSGCRLGVRCFFWWWWYL